MKVMITGHRPEKIGGYDENCPERKWVRMAILFAMKEMELFDQGPFTAITGMALGVDQEYAKLALKLGWNVKAFIPGTWQASQWPKASQDAYNAILGEVQNTCGEVVLCSEEPYNASALLRRNGMMVDDCDCCIAVWNGNSDGGTANAVRSVQKRGKSIYRIDPKTHRILGWH